MKTITLFRSTSGLNTKVDAARLHFDPKTGVTDLAAAYNIDIDDSGRPTRRRGRTILDATAMHSLFAGTTDNLVVQGTALGVLGVDPYSFTAIATVTAGARVSYVEIFNGQKHVIYYCNGYEKGRVIDGTHYSWVASAYSGPRTSRTFSDPPIGHLLAAYNGRVYIAVENVVWYSEPFSYSWFDLARNYMQFPTDIKMLAVATDGLFISTQSEIFSLTGPDPSQFTLHKVADCPAKGGTLAMVNAATVGNGEMKGILPMFTTDNGICLGAPQGQLMDLTERVLDIPESAQGAAVYTGKKYICSLED